MGGALGTLNPGAYIYQGWGYPSPQGALPPPPPVDVGVVMVMVLYLGYLGSKQNLMSLGEPLDP